MARPKKTAGSTMNTFIRIPQTDPTTSRPATWRKYGRSCHKYIRLSVTKVAVSWAGAGFAVGHARLPAAADTLHAADNAVAQAASAGRRPDHGRRRRPARRQRST